MSNFTLRASDGNARAGTLQAAHGTIDTPAFMPVGTAATVKALGSEDLELLGSQIILANLYHLWLRPGIPAIAEAGGLHRFMSWKNALLTDSGGFQIFSLESRRTIDDDGVTFRSHLDGSEHRFTPENVLAAQESLGVDIAMTLDVCPKLPATQAQVDEAVRVTILWAQRCANARTRDATMLFGIVQGGLDVTARERCAQALRELDFDGYAIGGLSVGESRAEMYAAARLTAQMLPEDRPRYLMGVGTVADLLEAVDAGVDLFDCVYPTRCGRNGRAMTSGGELNISNAVFIHDFAPVDARCACFVCARYSRAYLAHLFRAKEMLGPRLLSFHNLHVLLDLMRRAREAIVAHRWPAFRDHARSLLT